MTSLGLLENFVLAKTRKGEQKLYVSVKIGENCLILKKFGIGKPPVNSYS